MTAPTVTIMTSEHFEVPGLIIKAYATEAAAAFEVAYMRDEWPGRALTPGAVTAENWRPFAAELTRASGGLAAVSVYTLTIEGSDTQ